MAATRQNITIKDIAHRANVSKSTVSRVLNGTTAVAEDKKTAVLQAVADLNYQPNVMARGLAAGQSLTVGVLTQNITSPYNDAVLLGVLQGLRGSDYSPIFADGSWILEQEKQAIQTLVARQVDGLIVFGGETPDETICELAHQVPLVVAGRNIAGLSNQCVYVNNFAGAYKATQYLIELGHKRIVHLTGKMSHVDARERLRGYQQAMIDYGLELDEALVIEGNFQEQSGVLAVETLLLRGWPFTAIFAGSDQMAYGVRLALYRRGIRVPAEVSIIGFDDLGSSAYTTPPLTTVRQPAVAIGQAAAEALVAMLKAMPYSIPVFHPELIVRESAMRYP